MTMSRVTLRIPEEQIEEVEQMVDAGEFPTKSEAIRASVRQLLDDHRESSNGRLNAGTAVPDGGRDE